MGLFIAGIFDGMPLHADQNGGADHAGVLTILGRSSLESLEGLERLAAKPPKPSKLSNLSLSLSN